MKCYWNLTLGPIKSSQSIQSSNIILNFLYADEIQLNVCSMDNSFESSDKDSFKIINKFSK